MLKHKCKYRATEWLKNKLGVSLIALTIATMFVRVDGALLDQQIKAFKDAPSQTESAVLAILQQALKEGRSAMGYAAVRQWLSGNPTNSQPLLHAAGRAADFAGEWKEAAGFYRKLLKNPNVKKQFADSAVPAVYQMMVNHLAATDAAFIFMREDGDRLRSFGSARKFDSWFIEQAMRRQDFSAVASRLAVVYRSSEPLQPYASYLEALIVELESFNHGGKDLFDALRSLAAAKGMKQVDKARIRWISEIVPLSVAMAKMAGSKQKIHKTILTDAIQAANELIKASPYHGSISVMRGWMHYDVRDNATFNRFVLPRRSDKIAPLLEVIKLLPDSQARELLKTKVLHARGRKVVDYLFTAAEIRALIPIKPLTFNSLDAPDVPIFTKDLKVEQARSLAPMLIRNPHLSALMVRAWARPERKCSIVVDQIAKNEMWRSYKVKEIALRVWKSGMFESDGKIQATEKKYRNIGIEDPILLGKVAKNANSEERISAYKVLIKDLLSAAPKVRGALPLWDQLFANAPDADRISIFKLLLGDLKGDRLYLLYRAVAQSTFGGQRYALLLLQSKLVNNWRKYGRNSLIRALPNFADFLAEQLKTQAKKGEISKPIFTMWLSCIDPRQQRHKDVMKELLKSRAYLKLNKEFHEMASDSAVFGTMAMVRDSWSSEPSLVSKELLELRKEASPKEVENAFAKVMGRLVSAPMKTSLVGLEKVATLKKWSPATRAWVLSLYRENAPIGSYPEKCGYEKLVRRLAEEAQSSTSWSDLEPYLAGFWQAAARPSHPKAFGALQLSVLTEKMEAKNAASLAMSSARAALRGEAGRVLLNKENGDLQKILGSLKAIPGKVAAAIGAVEIPVAESDPAYPIYKSNAEFILGNFDSAWAFYQKGAETLPELLRKTSVEYGFWLLKRNTELENAQRAEQLVKELTIWSRQAEGTFSSAQDAELKIAYADLAYFKGILPTSRAWYRKVADAKEYQGSEVGVRAALGSVKVDRTAKDYNAALTELDRLMRIRDTETRIKVHFARAEVFLDQQNGKEALEEIDAVLRRQPKHSDALILQGKIHNQMRNWDVSREIRLGPSQENTCIVPGEILKINLLDPTLRVSGVGADIEVEVWAKSGDSERIMLRQIGDNKEKFRAELQTALGPPVKGDKILQVLGEDAIRYGYSKRFRAKMKDLPEDPDVNISVASDAEMSFSAGAFPPREGERKLDVSELGLSTAQAALGVRSVRPGNPVYLRVNDPDQSKTAENDEIYVSLETSSGDEIRRLKLTETSPFSGEFQAIIPTSGAQAQAFASESAPGSDPNMAISKKAYPAWQGVVGDSTGLRMFGVDFNDRVAPEKLVLETGGKGSRLTHFVLQTSMNGVDWTSLNRFPETSDPWQGQPQITSFPTYSANKRALGVSVPKNSNLPPDWLEKMELTSSGKRVAYRSAVVKSISDKELPIVDTGHPNYPALVRYRARFYQASSAVRRFKLVGYTPRDDKGNINTIFLLNGKPASEDSESPLYIERELAAGVHEIEIWRHEGRAKMLKQKPRLLCDIEGKDELQACPESMFNIYSFPQAIRDGFTQPARVSSKDTGLEISFGDRCQLRAFRIVITGFTGVAPVIKKLIATDRAGKQLLPVAQDYQDLRANNQLEVVPGDQIIARYSDPISATPKRTKHGRRLQVAYNNAKISASFLNYETTEDGRKLLLEPIRRFRFDDAVAIVIEDPDRDASPQRDTVDVNVITSSGGKTVIKALETDVHSGKFVGKVFPVMGQPTRASEIQMVAGGTLSAVYRDQENLNPGIPSDRKVTISHAKYDEPKLSVYNVSSKKIAEKIIAPQQQSGNEKRGPVSGNFVQEMFPERRSLEYVPTEAAKLQNEELSAIIGASVHFDVVISHLALAQTSELKAYVQTESGRKAMKRPLRAPFDVGVPGTIKLSGKLKPAQVSKPLGYRVTREARFPSNTPPLEEGRFSFSIPLILGNQPTVSYGNKAAAALPASAIPDGLVVRAGEVIHIGFPYKDAVGEVQWKNAKLKVKSHGFLDVMDSNYHTQMSRAFVGEKVYVRVVDKGMDKGPGRDIATVMLKSTNGAATEYELRETEPHSGIFKGGFALSYADKKPSSKLPSVALNGFPVLYGENISVAYHTAEGKQSFDLTVNKGADGVVEPFSKRFTGDEMAVRTSFVLAECFFELAKKHREMEQESLARREIAHAQKLLAEAIASHRDDGLKAHAEYLLGNLAQEFADLAKNDAAKLPMYQDALSRFIKINSDYADTKFASKAQFKTALVYEKMGEINNAVEEYIKLAYKYPNDELIPEVMSRLGGYYQKKGLSYKKKADPKRESKDAVIQAEVLRLDRLSYVEFLNAAMIFSKLEERFPDDKIAGLAGLRASQNFMRAHQYDAAIEGFEKVFENESYDNGSIRSQAMYWCGLSFERSGALMSEQNYKGKGQAKNSAYKLYRRVTFDFPSSKWAKYARGRLSDPVFAKIIEKEKIARERMIESLKQSLK